MKKEIKEVKIEAHYNNKVMDAEVSGDSLDVCVCCMIVLAMVCNSAKLDFDKIVEDTVKYVKSENIPTTDRLKEG